MNTKPNGADKQELFPKQLKHVGAILNATDIRGSEKLVLVALVDHKNRYSARCDPSIPGLVKRLGNIGHNTVRDALDKLERLEYIQQLERSGQTNQFEISLPQIERFLPENLKTTPTQSGKGTPTQSGKGTPTQLGTRTLEYGTDELEPLKFSGVPPSNPEPRPRKSDEDSKDDSVQVIAHSLESPKTNNGKRGFQLSPDGIADIDSGVNFYRRAYEKYLQGDFGFLPDSFPKDLGIQLKRELTKVRHVRGQPDIPVASRDAWLNILANWKLFKWHYSQSDYKGPCPEPNTLDGISKLVSLVNGFARDGGEPNGKLYGQDFADRADEILEARESAPLVLVFNDDA